MKLLILPFIVAANLFGQVAACSHTLAHSPGSGSAILLYRNGQLLKQNTDYSGSGLVISPSYWYSSDVFSVVYDRVLSATIPTTALTYNLLSQFREDFTCAGSQDPTALMTTLNYDQTTHDALGTGMIAVEIAGEARQIGVDTATVLFRAQPPPGPGPCNSGTGDLAFSSVLSVCIQNGLGNGFVWAQFVGMQTSWTTNSVVLAVDSAATSPPTGVQWTITYDPTLISGLAETVSVPLGQSGFIITCAPGTNSLICLIPPTQVVPATTPATFLTLADGVVATIQPVLTTMVQTLVPSMFAVSNVVATDASGNAVTVSIAVQ